MPDCIFCKIISGDIQSVKVYEDAEFTAFLDINPVQPGHTLVVPKAHFARFDDTPSEVVAKLFTRWCIKWRRRWLRLEGFNASLNNGLAAGQEVFHTHVHIIPRYIKDGLVAWPRYG
jgi:histidine triad (HIT) family protein